MNSRVAALLPHSAERLRLSVASPDKTWREAMPRAIIIVALLLLTAYCSLLTSFAATWTRQPSGTMSWLHAIYFLDENRGWVAGSNGTLLQTTDGGATWKKLSLLNRDTIQDVYFADERNGWLLRSRDFLKLKTNESPSYLLKTDDGAVTWHQVSLNPSDSNTRFVRLVFADAQHGWVFGETGLVFATSDGGAHWMRQTSATKHLLLGGTFTDYEHGCLVGAGSTVMRTSNSGASWQTSLVRDGANARLTAASMIGNFGWAVGAAGQIFATADAGRTWSMQRSNVDADLSDVKFIDAREGWAVGAQGTLLHTRDGGARWFVERIESSHALQRLFINDRNHLWAVGFGGTVLKFGESNATPPRLK